MIVCRENDFDTNFDVLKLNSTKNDQKSTFEHTNEYFDGGVLSRVDSLLAGEDRVARKTYVYKTTILEIIFYFFNDQISKKLTKLVRFSWF